MNLTRRGLPSLALCVLPLLAPPAAHSAPANPATTAAAFPAGARLAGGPARLRAPLSLATAVSLLPVAAEHREGYERDLYNH